jgi:N6-adenosine-specific RNA methylase IME4
VATKRYRTIVADPPWHWHRPSGWGAGTTIRPLEYPTLSVSEIAALPIRDYVADVAHLYLWTTNRYLENAFQVVRAWGFNSEGTTVLVWCKEPRGIGPGGRFSITTEFVLFARRGVEGRYAGGRHPTTWFKWPRGRHSEKPDGFLDLVEQVSPGPYLELFARRARFGWDYWGDESLETVEMPT